MLRATPSRQAKRRLIGAVPRRAAAGWRAALFLCVPLLAAAVGAGQNEPRILLINSYGPDVRWCIELTAGVREGLMARSSEAGLVIKHLDSDPVSSEAAAAKLAKQIREAHGIHLFDVAITADDAAYRFILKHHDSLLPGVPIVFCGVADYSPRELDAHRLVTGLVQLPDLKKPLTMALRRQQRYGRLVVIHDGTPAGLAYRRQVEAMMPDLKALRPDIEMAFLSGRDLSTTELIERVRQLPLDCMILFTVWYHGSDGEFRPRNDLLPRISLVSPVPVYSVTDLAGEFDTSREHLLQAHRQGLAAADIAVKILRGIPPSEIPVTVTGADPNADGTFPAPGMTQWPPAQRQDARQEDRPTISRGHLLTLAAVALTAQMALIGFLVLTVRRRRIIQRALEESRRRLELILDKAQLGVFEWDIAAGQFQVNSHFAEMLGRQPGDIGPTLENWKALVHPDDLERVLRAMADYLDDQSTVYEARYRMQTEDGSYRWVLARGEAVQRGHDGTPTRLVGVHIDIDGIVDLFAGFDVE